MEEIGREFNAAAAGVLVDHVAVAIPSGHDKDRAGSQGEGLGILDGDLEAAACGNEQVMAEMPVRGVLHERHSQFIAIHRTEKSCLPIFHIVRPGAAPRVRPDPGGAVEIPLRVARQHRGFLIHHGFSKAQPVISFTDLTHFMDFPADRFRTNR